MKCAVGFCGHCQFGPAFVCKDGPVFPLRIDRLLRIREDARSRWPRASPSSPCWKFASCDGCQLSLLDCEDELLAVAGAVEIAYFLEASRAVVRGPYDCRSSKARSRRRTTPSASARSGAQSKSPRHHRRLRHGGRHPGAAQLRRTWRSSRRSSTPSPEYIETLATSTPIADHVQVDFELRGCPIDKHQLLEVLSALLHGRTPEHSPAQRLRGVQAAGHRLRDGRARHAVPGPGDARRLRRAVPGLRPRLLRLLRPEGDAEHVVARASRGSALGQSRPRRSCARSAPSTRAPSPSAKESEAHDERRTRTIKVDALARVEGEGALHVEVREATRSPTCGWRSSSRRASSRRSCAAATFARPPTSRRASAASARSRTR